MRGRPADRATSSFVSFEVRGASADDDAGLLGAAVGSEASAPACCLLRSQKGTERNFCRRTRLQNVQVANDESPLRDRPGRPIRGYRADSRVLERWSCGARRALSCRR